MINKLKLLIIKFLNRNKWLYGIDPKDMPYGNSEHQIWQDLANFRSYKDAHRKYASLVRCRKNEELYKTEFRAGVQRGIVINEIKEHRKVYSQGLQVKKIVNYLLPHQKEAWSKYRI